MPELMVTTSWDDGTWSDLRLAELMEKYGIKGTFYVPRRYMEDPLSREDIIALDKKFEIGSHTLNHVDLTSVLLKEAEQEIKGSKEYLEGMLGHSVAMFCYPKGRYNRDIIKMVRDAGYLAARTANPGGLELPYDSYEWPITLYASNGSPLRALKIWWGFRLWKTNALLDWESRAKSLFDAALPKGGVYHLYGHSAEFEDRQQWSKVERVFQYISHRQSVRYVTNGEIFKTIK